VKGSGVVEPSLGKAYEVPASLGRMVAVKLHNNGTLWCRDGGGNPVLENATNKANLHADRLADTILEQRQPLPAWSRGELLASRRPRWPYAPGCEACWPPTPRRAFLDRGPATHPQWSPGRRNQPAGRCSQSLSTTRAARNGLHWQQQRPPSRLLMVSRSRHAHPRRGIQYRAVPTGPSPTVRLFVPPSCDGGNKATASRAVQYGRRESDRDACAAASGGFAWLGGRYRCL